MLKVINGGKAPTRGSKYSAAIDLYANEDVIIGAGETAIVPLGVCIDLEKILDGIDYFYPHNEGMLPKHKLYFFMKTNYLQLEPRSSLRAKGLQAGTGVIDLDFTQEIKIILHNPFTGFDSNGNPTDAQCLENVSEYKIKKGDKIAQIMLKEHKTFLMGIDTEEERNGGFGSTGA